MSYKDIEIKITFEEDGRPKVTMSIIFKDSEDMGEALLKFKEACEKVFSTEGKDVS